MFRRAARSFGLALALLLAAALPLAADPADRALGSIERILNTLPEPESIGLSLGGTGVLDDAARGEATWEIQFPGRRFARWPRNWPAPHPLAGVLATTDGSIYPYLGLAVRLPLSPRFWFTPSLAAGAYVHAGGFDLGAPIEFRSRAEVVYQLSAQSRIGLSFGHLSNSGITRRNPGTESLSLTFYSSLRAGGWRPD